jgi:tetratricopeptide (TPR) repeat protein
MTDWVSASAMLLAGIIVGAMFLFGMRRRKDRTDLERADLEAKRDALVARLREHPDPQLEREAAEVLRKLDKIGGAPATSPVRAAEAGSAPQNAALKGFAWGAGSVAVLAGIGFFVMQQAKPKETAPAQTVSSAAAKDPAVADLERSVAQNPENLQLRDDLAKAYLDRNNIDGVAEQTRYVLQRDPNDARALTYSGVVHIIAQQPEAASAMFDKATKSDPNLVDAWVGVAWISAMRGDMPKAEAAMTEAKKRHPDMAPRLDELMAHLRNPQQPPAQAPAAAAAATPAPATNASDAIHLTLNFAGQAHGTIFVIGREAGMTAGPPAAVKRVPLSAFPIQVDITQGDSMMGQPLPQKMRIEVRIDSDNDPMTRDPKDPSAVAEGVALGKSVVMTLK